MNHIPQSNISGRLMRTLWLALLLLTSLALGCASPSIRPNAQVRRSFNQTDAVHLEINGVATGRQQVTNPDFISRLQEIHARSKWDPIPITNPADLVSIVGLSDGQQQFKLVYGAGWIMETKDGEIVRWRRIRDEKDRVWMRDNIRSRFPPNPGLI